jgi:uncharacterized protein YunC (DUF1805 family)
VQSEGNPTFDIALKVCGVRSVDQVLDQHLASPEEEEEVVKHKPTLLDALKGLEAARKYRASLVSRTVLL